MNYSFNVRLIDPVESLVEWEGPADALLSSNEDDDAVRETLDSLSASSAGERALCGFFHIVRVD